MGHKKTNALVNEIWDNSILPTLSEYIKIPNKSPQFDPAWREHGYMDAAVALIVNWCQTLAVKNMQLEVIRLENRTPIILIDIPGDEPETVLLYGHLDKQPEMVGWEKGLGPWSPVFRDDKLYGRGAADDGYAVFAALTAIKSLQEQHTPHSRCLILIEACEESGSLDLPFYIDALQERIGKPHLVICLDSGCGNYQQLWLTTSLRGLTSGILTIDVLKEGLHSGFGSGVVPNSFRILRQLLARIEDDKTGNILLKNLYVDIPPTRMQQAEQAALILGNSLLEEIPLLPNVEVESISFVDLILRRTFKPALSITGCDDIPNIKNAGNVTLPKLSVKLSMRLPPTCDAKVSAHLLKKVLEQHPPQNAHIHYEILDAESGWDAPLEKPWLTNAAQEASQLYFGHDAAYMGEGGSIPFMGLLGKKFPQAQFLITGVLGPHSNAHGPNEFLHIPTGKKLTACIAHIIAEQFKNRKI